MSGMPEGEVQCEQSSALERGSVYVCLMRLSESSQVTKGSGCHGTF